VTLASVWLEIESEIEAAAMHDPGAE